MQVFMPYPDFKRSIQCLDYRRLGKQRVEAKQIINILDGVAKPNKNGKIAWVNHPAVKMWDGYSKALKQYHDICITEWVERGYNNNMPLYNVQGIIVYPEWLGRNAVHASHRSNLLRKDYEFYSKYGWVEPITLDYVWVV